VILRLSLSKLVILYSLGTRWQSLDAERLARRPGRAGPVPNVWPVGRAGPGWGRTFGPSASGPCALAADAPVPVPRLLHDTGPTDHTAVSTATTGGGSGGAGGPDSRRDAGGPGRPPHRPGRPAAPSPCARAPYVAENVWRLKRHRCIRAIHISKDCIGEWLCTRSHYSLKGELWIGVKLRWVTGCDRPKRHNSHNGTSSIPALVGSARGSLCLQPAPTRLGPPAPFGAVG
jgi:hypothetical protein